MKYTHLVFVASIALLFSLVGCDHVAPRPGGTADSPAASQTRGGPPGGPAHGALEGPFEFQAPPVFDIDATPNGSILAAATVFPQTEIPPEGTSTTTIKEVTQRGIQDVVDISTAKGSPINGLESIGRGSFFATSGGLDQGVGAGVWHVSRGNARLVGDVEAFEKENDPDAFEGLQWKDPKCEINPQQGFTAGPQSNPYHLARLSGSTALVADAAGNTLLTASTSGTVDWVAALTPPTKGGTGAASSSNREDWRVLFPLNESTNCYVQPVPTAVDVGPDGAYYVGELTGVTPANLGGSPSTGLSRVWRIEPGARNVTCPSGDCEVVMDGLTSVIDAAFGPKGYLYVVEYDANGWFAATSLGNAAGGAIKRCDVDAGTCSIVEDGLTLPGAITFDKRGTLWVLENNIGAPTVRKVKQVAAHPNEHGRAQSD